MLCLSPELRMCSAESRAEATLRSAARPRPALMVVERPMQSPARAGELDRDPPTPQALLQRSGGRAARTLQIACHCGFAASFVMPHRCEEAAARARDRRCAPDRVAGDAPCAARAIRSSPALPPPSRTKVKRPSGPRFEPAAAGSPWVPPRVIRHKKTPPEGGVQIDQLRVVRAAGPHRRLMRFTAERSRSSASARSWPRPAPWPALFPMHRHPSQRLRPRLNPSRCTEAGRMAV